MTSLELFTEPRLPCPQRVHLVIHELGLDVTTTAVNLETGENRLPNFLRLNPFGSVPCLKDSSVDPPLVLYESRSICRYLASRYGAGRLMPDPKDVRGSALFEQAASAEVAMFDPVANRLVFETVMKPYFQEDDPLPDEGLVAILLPRLGRILDVLDGILGGQGYMAGDECTLVDMFYVPYMHHLATSVWPDFVKNRPHLAAWWEGMKARSSYQVLCRALA